SRARWVYVYLLLEFQSRSDRYMALRLMSYLSLLYQDLLRQKPGDGRALPPVLPMVLYNGPGRWTAPREMSGLIDSVHRGLARYRPELRYLLLDQAELGEAALPVDNLAATFFRLERSRDPAGLVEALGDLNRIAASPAMTEVRRAFTAWLRQVLLPARLPGATIQGLEDIQEIRTMLAERVIDWTRQWKQQGLEEG
ncbi:Rpn family recombination-promoting nuclease/putative transposase, partial [Pigmentiphaga soli]|uniref:Rpn family recombination-promoting nuclease/putative transposase n=1 Tax=Pigmentiphaga soli TaxID=1007095 RepID=UPI0031E61069